LLKILEAEQEVTTIGPARVRPRTPVAAVIVTAAIAVLGGFEPQSSLIRVDGELELEPLTVRG
jgi:hypothetical protein